MKAELQKAIDLLSEFYEHGQPDYDRTLVIQLDDQSGRLQSTGTSFQDVATPTEKVKNLKRYQEEMASFAKFSGQRYWGI